MVSPAGRRAQLKRLDECRTVHDYYDFSCVIGQGSTQIEREIVDLLERVRETSPERVCEIGTLFGGTPGTA